MLTLFLGLLISAWGVVLARKSQTVGLVLIGALGVYRSDAALVPIATFGGGTEIFLEDVVFGVLAGATLVAFGTLRSNVKLPRVIALLLTLLAYAFLRGLQTYGPTAYIEFRYFLFPIAGIAYLLSFPADQHWEERYRAWLRWTGLALCTLAAYHLATRGLGRADELIYEGGVYRTTRILIASQALILTFAALAEVDRWLRERRPSCMVYAGLFGVALLLAQHRSVWAAAAVGMLILLATGQRVFRATPVIISVAVVTVATVLLYISGALAESLGSIERTLAAVGQTNSTFSNRLQSWDQLMADYRHSEGPLVHMFGFPFGHGYMRVVDGVLYKVSPHNYYIHLLLRAGPLGTACFVVVLAAAFLGKDRTPLRSASIAVLATFAYAYSLTWAFAPILAFILLAPREPRLRVQAPGDAATAARPGSSTAASTRLTATHR
jgi:hypothetical protein